MKFSVQPTDVTAAATMAPVVVDLENPTSSDPVTMSIGTNPGGGTLTVTLTVNSVNGVAVFNDLEIDVAANGYTLVATAPQQRSPTNPPKGFQPGVVGVSPQIKQFQAGYYYNYPPCGTIYSHNTVSNGEVHPNLNPAPVTESVTSNPFNVLL